MGKIIRYNSKNIRSAVQCPVLCTSRKYNKLIFDSIEFNTQE